MSTSETGFSFERAMKRVDSYPFVHRFLPVDRYLVRPLASVVVKAVFKTEVTPNQLTTTSFVLAVLGAFLYTGGRHGFFVLGGFLALFSAVMDAADGMLARAKGLTSRYGAYLDLFLDRIADFVVLAGATYGYFKHTRSYGFLIFGFVTIGLYFLQLGLYYVNLLYLRADRGGEGAEAKSLAVFVIFLVSVASRPDLILVAVFSMSLIGTVVKIVRFLSKGRDPEPVQIR